MKDIGNRCVCFINEEHEMSGKKWYASCSIPKYTGCFQCMGKKVYRRTKILVQLNDFRMFDRLSPFWKMKVITKIKTEMCSHRCRCSSNPDASRTELLECYRQTLERWRQTTLEHLQWRCSVMDARMFCEFFWTFSTSFVQYWTREHGCCCFYSRN